MKASPQLHLSRCNQKKKTGVNGNVFTLDTNSPTAKAKYRNTIKYVTQRGRSSMNSLSSP